MTLANRPTLTNMSKELPAWEYGDEVDVDGIEDWRCPCTVCCRYHTGEYRVETKHGQPKVGIAPERISEP